MLPVTKYYFLIGMSKAPSCSVLIHSWFRLETEQFNTVLDAMFEYPVEPNQKVIAEGDDGDNFYVIENGVYDVIKVSIFFPDTNNQYSYRT